MELRKDSYGLNVMELIIDTSYSIWQIWDMEKVKSTVEEAADEVGVHLGLEEEAEVVAEEEREAVHYCLVS